MGIRMKHLKGFALNNILEQFLNEMARMLRRCDSNLSIQVGLNCFKNHLVLDSTEDRPERA